MKKINHVDPWLEKKLQLALEHYLNFDVHDKHYLHKWVTKKFPNMAVIRPNWNKYQVAEILRLDKKLFKNFVDFLDMATDLDPQWCFVSGRYIPPFSRGTSAIKVFPKGEWAYLESFDAYINHNNVEDKLTVNSKLICIAVRPTEPTGYASRPRVINTEDAIKQHILQNPEGFYIHDIIRVNSKDSYWNWKLIRATYFLKPSGKPFPQVK